MDRVQKFLQGIESKKRARLIAAMDAITQGKLEGLDIQPLKNQKNWFRCRIGDIRIIFVRIAPGTHVVTDMEFRGKVYKRI